MNALCNETGPAWEVGLIFDSVEVCVFQLSMSFPVEWLHCYESSRRRRPVLEEGGLKTEDDEDDDAGDDDHGGDGRLGKSF